MAYFKDSDGNKVSSLDEKINSEDMKMYLQVSVKQNGYFDRKRREQSKYWLTETIDEQLRAHFYQNPDIARLLAEKERMVLDAEESPFTAAQEILDNYFGR